MTRTKIEWVSGWPDGKPGYSWNPIKGLCPVGCWYCYARPYYTRFKWDKYPRLDEKELQVWGSGSATSPRGPEKSSRVFVCSTFEIFHPMADKWRDKIFKIIEARPRHTFFILTKFPQRIDRPMPENVWLGVSVEHQLVSHRTGALYDAFRYLPESKNRFISFEPLLGKIDIKQAHGRVDNLPVYFPWFKWIIIGRMTGHGRKHDPKPEWIADIAKAAKEAGVPVFMKNNLAPIWPGRMIQEFPR